MKQLLVYYTIIILPFTILCYCFRKNMIGDDWFLISFLFYAFVYRTYIDYTRLRSKNVIEKNHFWKLFIPGFRIKYFTALYFI